MASNNKKFRINCKNFLLTYHRCGLSHQELYDKLIQKKIEIQYVMIVRDTQLHCLLQLKKDKDVRNDKFFDIDNFHPDIKSAPDSNDIRDTFLENEDLTPFERGVYLSMKQSDIQKRARKL